MSRKVWTGRTGQLDTWGFILLGLSPLILWILVSNVVSLIVFYRIGKKQVWCRFAVLDRAGVESFEGHVHYQQMALIVNDILRLVVGVGFLTNGIFVGQHHLEVTLPLIIGSINGILSTTYIPGLLPLTMASEDFEWDATLLLRPSDDKCSASHWNESGSN